MPPKEPIVYLEDMTRDQLMEKIEKLFDERRESDRLIEELRKKMSQEFSKGVQIGFKNASKIAYAMSDGKIDVIKATKEKKDRTTTVFRKKPTPPKAPGAAGEK